jgi:hypothetical protein
LRDLVRQEGSLALAGKCLTKRESMTIDAKALRAELDKLIKSCRPTREEEDILYNSRSQKKKDAVYAKVEERKAECLERVNDIVAQLQELAVLEPDKRPLAVYEMSVHAQRAFEELGVDTVGQLLRRTQTEVVEAVDKFSEMPNMGAKVLIEIKELLINSRVDIEGWER